MDLPEQYKNLTKEEKRVIVLNLISQYWNKKYQETVNNLTDEQIEFLFKYFFTKSKEEREKMWNEMKKKYETTLKELKDLAKKLQKLDLQFAELLAKKKDAEEFRKNIK